MSNKIYGLYNRPVFEGIKNTEPSMTQQQYKDECDINNIVDVNMHYKDPAFVTKMMLSGKTSDSKPIFGDFTQVQSYYDALNAVNNAQEMFSSLPAHVRRRFNDDPGELVAFVEDKANNYEEGLALGIYEKDDNFQNPIVAGSNVNVEPISGSSPETSAQSLT